MESGVPLALEPRDEAAAAQAPAAAPPPFNEFSGEVALPSAAEEAAGRRVESNAEKRLAPRERMGRRSRGSDRTRADCSSCSSTHVAP